MVLALNLLSLQQSHATTHFVDIVDFAFSPATLTIQEGDTVTWTQKDNGMVHTATSDTAVWDSGFLSFNQMYSFTFNNAGAFNYFCDLHPDMTGTITVESAGPPPPSVSIISPTHNANYPAPSNVMIEATASATGATITNIEFLNGTTSLGNITNTPYRIITPFAAGTHNLTARATDSNGGTATSAAITISVQGVGTRITNAFAERISKSDLTIELTKIAEGMVSPLGLTYPNDGTGRLFIYDQVGFIHVIENGVKLSTPLLDVRSRLVPFGNYDERGLLGAATHPLFGTHPYIYTYTSETNGAAADFPSVLTTPGSTNNHQSVITEWRIDVGNPNQVDPASRREIMRIDQPQSNHNGGALRFGPDGYLYFSLGDGGSSDDQANGHSPEGNGQDKNNLYGTVVRIDIAGNSSANGQYSIPADNPFVNADGLDEIYAWGFRNPYTFSFDRANGELYVADVGQNQIEEVNRVFKGGNYGWPIKEGGFFFDPAGGAPGFITTAPVRSVPHDLIDPIAQYDHDDGLAIVGGYVYRGTKIPGLTGRYVAGDWGTFATASGRLYFMDRSEFKEFRIGLNNRTLGRWLKGFGEDSEGELYVFGSTTLGPNGATGEMYKIIPAPRDVVCGVSVSGSQVNLDWASGVGPFVAQTKTDLSDPLWQNASATNGNTASFPTTGTQQFFRVSDLAGNPAIPFTVHLTGDAERPTPVSTSGTGAGILSLEGNTLHFNVSYAGLSSAASAAHIHGAATVSEFAGILIDLGTYNGGRWGTDGVLFGSITLTPLQKALFLDGRTYINIHTATHPGGEIRGQIAPVVFTSSLNGASERPQPVATPATGSAILLLAGNQLKLNLSYRDLLTTANAAHIHGPASSSEFAGVLINLASMHNGAFGTSGSFSGTTTLTAQQLSWLLEGKLYINVHSSGNPGGEIRGQLFARSTAVPFTVPLNGEAERPTPIVTSGMGSGSLFLEANRLHFELGYSDLSAPAIAAHIHGFADTSVAAGIQVDLGGFNNGAFGTRGAFSGQVTLTDEQRALLAQAKTYINVHSTQYPGGEIRGQVAPALMQVTLLGASVRPNAVQAGANGSARFLLLEKQLHANASFTTLESSQTTANVFGPAGTDETAASLVSLGSFPTSGGISASVLLNQPAFNAMVDGVSYLSLQTTNRPNGEMRGQIIP